MKVSWKLFVMAVMFLATSLSAQMIWTEATSSAGWQGRWSHGTVVFNSELWVMGGDDSTIGPHGQSLNDVWHSSDGTNWNLATDSADWTPRCAPALVFDVFDPRMWVMGGVGQQGLSNDVWSSIDGAHWTQVTSSAGWSPRAWGGAVVFDGKMWILGGVDSIGEQGPARVTNDVWNSSDGANWTRVTDNAAWPARIGPAALAFDGKMWIVGGAGQGGLFNEVWYSANGADWILATQHADWAPRQFLAALTFGNKMWILGGCEEGEGRSFGDVWYSTDGAVWTQAEPQAPWPTRFGHTVADFNGKMWLLGGADSTRILPPLNDVWWSTGVGLQEEKRPTSHASCATPTVVRSVLLLAESPSSSASTNSLLDIGGREAMELHSGVNDVRALAPGVYFVRRPVTEDGRPGASIRKVVLTK